MAPSEAEKALLLRLTPEGAGGGALEEGATSGVPLFADLGALRHELREVLQEVHGEQLLGASAASLSSSLAAWLSPRYWRDQIFPLDSHLPHTVSLLGKALCLAFIYMGARTLRGCADLAPLLTSPQSAAKCGPSKWSRAAISGASC